MSHMPLSTALWLRKEVSTAIGEACEGRIAIPQIMARICHCFDSKDPRENYASRRLKSSIPMPSRLPTPKMFSRQRFIAASLGTGDLEERVEVMRRMKSRRMILPSGPRNQ